MRVHIRADAETKHAHVPLAGLFHIADDLILDRVAHRWQAVGEEDDNVRAFAGAGPQGQRLLQRIINGRATEGLEVFDELLRAAPMVLCSIGEFVEQRFDLSREAKDLKAVAVVQVLHAERQRLLRLLQLRTGHRSGSVEHEGHILGHDFGVLRIDARRGEQEEVAVLSGILVGEKIQAKVVLLLCEEKLEVGVGLHVARFVADSRLRSAVAFDFHPMARRVDGFQETLRFEIDLEADGLDGLGGEFFRVEREDEIYQSRVGLQQLRVGQGDALAAVWFDGKDADFEEIAPGIFQQRGIAQAAHDVLVDAAGFVGGQQFGLHGLAVDLHREFVDLRALGNRKQEGAFKLAWVGIIELLLDGRGGQLVLNLHVSLGVADLQRCPSDSWRRQPAGRVWWNRQDLRPRPVFFIRHDDETCGERRQHHRQPEQKNENAFHARLDGKGGGMLRGIGVMECWSDGIKNSYSSVIPILHHSTSPTKNARRLSTPRVVRQMLLSPLSIRGWS